MTTTWAPHSGGTTTDSYEIHVDLRAVAPEMTAPLGPYVPPAMAEEFAREADSPSRMLNKQGPWGLSTALRSRGAHPEASHTRPLPGRGHRPDRLRPKRTILSRVAARLVL